MEFTVLNDMQTDPTILVHIISLCAFMMEKKNNRSSIFSYTVSLAAKPLPHVAMESSVSVYAQCWSQTAVRRRTIN